MADELYVNAPIPKPKVAELHEKEEEELYNHSKLPTEHGRINTDGEFSDHLNVNIPAIPKPEVAELHEEEEEEEQEYNPSLPSAQGHTNMAGEFSDHSNEEETYCQPNYENCFTKNIPVVGLDGGKPIEFETTNEGESPGHNSFRRSIFESLTFAYETPAVADENYTEMTVNRHNSPNVKEESPVENQAKEEVPQLPERQVSTAVLTDSGVSAVNDDDMYEDSGEIDNDRPKPTATARRGFRNQFENVLNRFSGNRTGVVLDLERQKSRHFNQFRRACPFLKYLLVILLTFLVTVLVMKQYESDDTKKLYELKKSLDLFKKAIIRSTSQNNSAKLLRTEIKTSSLYRRIDKLLEKIELISTVGLVNETAFKRLADWCTDNDIGQGWIIAQCRKKPFKMSMNRTWQLYKQGFRSGNEYWIGLARLESYGNFTLRIESIRQEALVYKNCYTGQDIFCPNINYCEYKSHCQSKGLLIRQSEEYNATMGSEQNGYAIEVATITNKINCTDRSIAREIPFSTFDRGPNKTLASKAGGGFWMGLFREKEEKMFLYPNSAANRFKKCQDDAIVFDDTKRCGTPLLNIEGVRILIKAL